MSQQHHKSKGHFQHIANMFGRAVLLRLPVRQRLPLSLPSQHHTEVSSRALFSQIHWNYAGKPGRPRNVVGEPSRPVKRSAKRAAPKATNPEDSPAKQGNEARKKVAAEKKSTAARTKKQPKPRKELTEAQQAAKLARTQTEKIRALKKVALDGPTVPAITAYTLFNRDFVKKSGLNGHTETGQSPKDKLAEHAKALGAAWKECSPADVEVC